MELCSCRTSREIRWDRKRTPAFALPHLRLLPWPDSNRASLDGRCLEDPTWENRPSREGFSLPQLETFDYPRRAKASTGSIENGFTCQLSLVAHESFDGGSLFASILR